MGTATRTKKGKGDVMGKRKAMSFSSYKKVRKMSYQEMCRWIELVTVKAAKQGTETMTKTHWCLNRDLLRDFLITVPGVGPKIADKIIAGLETEEKKADAEKEKEKTMSLDDYLNIED